MERKRYFSIDGLRAISCFAIIAMHIQANASYQINGWLYDTAIPSWTQLVTLFIMISGFSMCAGYLEAFQSGSCNLETFYKRRYAKILPFFGFLILIALVIEHELVTLYEGTVELTLLHGLLPNNDVSVIGVCWTLGVIFLFYLLFPAYSVLLKSKKRAWIALGIAIWVAFVCEQHFYGPEFVTKSFTPRHNFLYYLPVFIAGGLIYLYRDVLARFALRFRWLMLGCCAVATVAWYLLPSWYIKSPILFSMWLMYAVAVDSKFLGSKPMKYFSGISMEMYLAQMVIFRALEKLKLLYVFGNGWLGFAAAFVMEIAGLVVFIEGYRHGIAWLKTCVTQRKERLEK